MTKTQPFPPDPEALPALYLRLVTRMERLEGAVHQLLAERTRDTVLLPTLRDVQELRSDMERLQEKLDRLSS